MMYKGGALYMKYDAAGKSTTELVMELTFPIQSTLLVRFFSSFTVVSNTLQDIAKEPSMDQLYSPRSGTFDRASLCVKIVTRYRL